MIVEKTLNKIVRDAVALIVNDPNYLVIQADQNAPRPTTPYCTVRLSSIIDDMLEQRSELDVDEDIQLTMEAHRRAFFSLKFFKGESFDIASKVKQGLMRETVQDFLNASGLGLATRSSLRNEVEQLENGFEDRTGFDAFFNFVEKDDEIVKTINSVEVSGEYQINGRSYPIEIK